MKKILTLTLVIAFAFSVKAQQGYLLLPADTPGIVKIKEGNLLRQITQQKVKVNGIAKFDGYRVEIYQGNDRKEAQEILEKFKEENPGVPAEMVFETPYVKIKVGIFRSKFEAQPLYYAAKKEFDGAKVVLVKGLPFPPLNGTKKAKEPNPINKEIEDF